MKQAKMVYLGNTVEQANTTTAAWTKLGWQLVSAQILPAKPAGRWRSDCPPSHDPPWVVRSSPEGSALQHRGQLSALALGKGAERPVR
jgi:hypothetical protein